MNRIYKIVKNALGQNVAVSELAKAKKLSAIVIGIILLLSNNISYSAIIDPPTLPQGNRTKKEGIYTNYKVDKGLVDRANQIIADFKKQHNINTCPPVPKVNKSGYNEVKTCISAAYDTNDFDIIMIPELTSGTGSSPFDSHSNYNNFTLRYSTHIKLADEITKKIETSYQYVVNQDVRNEEIVNKVIKNITEEIGTNGLGTLVFTDKQGNQLIRQDGKFYYTKLEDIADTDSSNSGNNDDNSATSSVATSSSEKKQRTVADTDRPVEIKDVFLSAVNPELSTQSPIAIRNVADANEKDQAVNKGQLDKVETKADNAVTTASTALTKATNASDKVDGFDQRIKEAETNAKNAKDGMDGLDGKIEQITKTISSIQNSGGNGLVLDDETTKTITVANLSDSNKLDISGSAGNRTLTGVKDGTKDNDAVNKGQLDIVDKKATQATETANTAKSTADDALTKATNASDKVDGFDQRIKDAETNAKNAKDGVDGLDGRVTELTKLIGSVGANGKDGTNGQDGLNSPAGKDGLNGKNLTEKITALRNGEAGSVVYADKDGNRVVRGDDGKLYQADSNGNADKTKAVASDKVKLVMVRVDGDTTQPTVVGNIAKGEAANDAVNKAQLDTAVSDLTKKIDGLSLSAGDSINRKDGTDGTNGRDGAAAKDSLNGKTLTAKVNALRNGEAGTLVYTDNKGQRVVRGEDGEFYVTNSEGKADTSSEAINKGLVQLATVGVDGLTTTSTKITNVKAGRVAKDSTDAVNGRQLYAVATSMMGNEGEMVVNPDGSVTFNANIKVYNNDGSESKVPSVAGAIDHINTKGTKYMQTNSELGNAQAIGRETVAIGGGAKAQADGAVAIGSGATAANPLDVAIGFGSATGLAGANAPGTAEFSVGSPDLKRRITNVADGILDSDAATVGQVRQSMAAMNQNLQHQIQQNRKIASQGIASTLALSTQVPNQHPGELALGLGSGFYDGQTALAVNGNYLSKSGKMNISLGVGTSLGNSSNKPAAKVGIGWVF